ncbi:ParB N-terminal domain-containing protein [Streptomyces sp. NPDC096136]|uniref:ParB N-terminal domain-containing protein n=1 Tax=Streptomyces sp. NPDC096136 TaxID=3366076 RepID=UPI00380AAB9A
MWNQVAGADPVDLEGTESPSTVSPEPCVSSVPVSSLLPGESPRLAGTDSHHAQTLAQVDGPLPPILVHRPSMRVIDGQHRLLAARLRGRQDIDVTFFDGDTESAFLLAVKANHAHGLPLTLADRTAAARRIMRTHPHWSDRAIAATAGLSATTVSGIRQRELPESPTGSRIGRDGKVRPINAAEGRRLAGRLMAEQPEASLREIARAAGIAPATVRDVRDRLRRGQNPVPSRQSAEKKALAARPGAADVARSAPRAKAAGRPSDIMQKLCKDPSLRFHEARRALLHWLGSHATSEEKWTEFLEQVPPHARPTVAEFARACAQDWSSFAEALERRSA